MESATALDLLTSGELTIEGRLLAASNATLLCTVTAGGQTAHCVYKPVAGERPLWDFPDGTLAARERAAYLVSEATGWSIVPPTVLREGPLGPGMCQLWMDPDPDAALVDVVAEAVVPAGWCPVLRAMDAEGSPVVLAHADDVRLRRIAILDAVLNNADRKGGHILPLPDGGVAGIDHGVCFAVEDKLRTVLWGWAGTPVDDAARSVLEGVAARLDGSLGDSLHDLLTDEEVAQVRARISRLLTSGVHPSPGEGWPAIPWPPF